MHQGSPLFTIFRAATTVIPLLPKEIQPTSLDLTSVYPLLAL